MSLAEFSFTTRARPIIELGLGNAPAQLGTAGWDVGLWDSLADTWVGSAEGETPLDGRWAVAFWGDEFPNDGLPAPADPGFTDAGDAHWSGFEPEFYDVTCDVIAAEIGVGRARTTDRFEVGFASITISNPDGKYDMRLPAPPPGAILALVPGRAMRIGIDHAVYGTRWLWRGYVDEVVPSYHPVEADVLTVSAIDAVGEVGRVAVPAVADPGVGSGESAANRVRRILAAARWWLPDGADIGPAATAMLPTTLGDSAANLLSVTAESEGGALFGDTAGRVAFRQRDWQSFDAIEPPDAFVGNVLPGDVCPTALELAFRRSDIVTRVVIGRVTDKTPRVYENRDGITMYGHETYEATDLITQDSSILTILAQRVLRTRSPDIQPRVEAVAFDAATADNVIDLLTLTDPRDPSRWNMTVDPGSGPVLADREMFVTGMRHVLERDSWTARYDLDLAWPYAIAHPFRWNTPGAGGTDLLVEPFDNLNAWSTSSASIVAGRTGSAANQGGSSNLTWTAPAPVLTRTIVGFAYRVSNVGATIRHLMQLRSDTVSANELTVRLNVDGSLSVLHGGTSGGVLGTTAAGLVAANVWVYVELAAYIHDTQGTATLRVNGTTVLDLSNIDTHSGTGPAQVAMLVLMGAGTGQSAQFDDLYVTVGAGAVFRGNITIPPYAAGSALVDPGYWGRRGLAGTAQWVNPLGVAP